MLTVVNLLIYLVSAEVRPKTYSNLDALKAAAESDMTKFVSLYYSDVNKDWGDGYAM